MAYATVTDATDRYGEEYIIVSCDRDSDAALDTASFELALDDASDWIDSFLFGHYDLPLTDFPRWLVRVCVDVAVFFSSETAGTMTTLKEERFKRAEMYMEQAKCGKRRLSKDGVNMTGRNKTQSAVIVISKDADDEMECGARRWTRRRTDGLL